MFLFKFLSITEGDEGLTLTEVIDVLKGLEEAGVMLVNFDITMGMPADDTKVSRLPDTATG